VSGAALTSTLAGVGEVTAELLALSLWKDAASDLLTADALRDEWMLRVTRFDGTHRSWREAVEPERRGPQATDTPANAAKRIARLIAAEDAVVAAAAMRPQITVTGAGSHTRYEWLAVLAADEIEDVGLLARVEKGDGARVTLAARNSWSVDRPVPFEHELEDGLAPARVAVLSALQQGQREAATQRRRLARRGRNHPRSTRHP